VIVPVYNITVLSLLLKTLCLLLRDRMLYIVNTNCGFEPGPPQWDVGEGPPAAFEACYSVPTTQKTPCLHYRYHRV